MRVLLLVGHCNLAEVDRKTRERLLQGPAGVHGVHPEGGLTDRRDVQPRTDGADIIRYCLNQAALRTIRLGRQLNHFGLHFLCVHDLRLQLSRAECHISLLL